MEENKNDIDELIKSIDSSFKEMSLKDIVSAHEDYFGAENISFEDDKTDEDNGVVEKVETEENKVKEKKSDDIKNDTAQDMTEFIKSDVSEDENEDFIEDVSVNLSDDEKKSEEDASVEKNGADSENDLVDISQKEKMRREKLKSAGRIGSWFQTFCYMRIPVIGFIYILVIAFSKNTPESKKEFAKGYILYKVLVWILAVVLLYCLYKIGLGFVDGMLSFIKE